jgi:hypothetical protein
MQLIDFVHLSFDNKLRDITLRLLNYYFYLIFVAHNLFPDLDLAVCACIFLQMTVS